MALLLLQPVLVAEDLTTKIHKLERGLRSFDAEDGPWSLEERMAFHKVPGVSLAIIDGGKIVFAKGYGVKEAGTSEKVDTETVFSMGSVSKIANAVLILRLAEAGVLDLSENVNSYLKRWKVPHNEYLIETSVNLRGLLSHSAGLSQWGFPNFLSDEPLPTIVETLEGRPPAKTKPVRVFYKPGTRWRYSGGGVMVSQLVVEDVTAKQYANIAEELIFSPLNMTRTTFLNPLPEHHGNIAKAHDQQGLLVAQPRGWQTMPEMAAAGLWTTPSDFARLIVTLINSYQGLDNSFLSASIAHDMMTKVGVSQFGLGPRVNGTGEKLRFHHWGGNDSYRAFTENFLLSGKGLVIVTNSSNGHKVINEVTNAVADAFEWPIYSPQSKPKAFQVTTVEMQNMVGTYRLRREPYSVQEGDFIGLADFYTGYNVELIDGVLWFEKEEDVFEGQMQKLIAISPTQFTYDGCYTMRSEGRPCFEFLKNMQGNYNQLIVYGTDSQSIIADRMD